MKLDTSWLFEPYFLVFDDEEYRWLENRAQDNADFRERQADAERLKKIREAMGAGNIRFGPARTTPGARPDALKGMVGVYVRKEHYVESADPFAPLKGSKGGEVLLGTSCIDHWHCQLATCGHECSGPNRTLPCPTCQAAPASTGHVIRPDVWCPCGHRWRPGPGRGYHVEELGCCGCGCKSERRPQWAADWAIEHGFELPLAPAE